MLTRVERTRPDVLIFDCDLPGLDAMDLLPAVRRMCPRIWIVAMCARPEERQPALRAGASAFAGKTDPPSRLLDMVRRGRPGHDARGVQPPDCQDRAGDTAARPSHEDLDGPRSLQRASTCVAAWEAEYVPKQGTVVINGSGRLSFEDLKGTAQATADLLLRNGASRVLLDCSEAVPDVKVLDVFDLPDCYQKAGVPVSARIALVLPRMRQSSDVFEFYETVCRNEGYTCRLFQDQRSAEQWLV